MNEHMESPETSALESPESPETQAFSGVSKPETSAAGNAVSARELISEAAISRSPVRVPRTRNTDDWMSGIQWLSSTVVLAVFVITFLAQAFQIPSQSMEKTLLIGDYLLVDKVHYAEGGLWNSLLPYSPIGRGDIIVFRYPVQPTQHFVKRVIGIPGDRVHLYRGRVFVNGKAVEDSAFAIHKSQQFDSYRDNFPAGNYISPEVNSRWWVEMHDVVHAGEIVVPPDKYFVMGDNRDESLDSRYWGFVPRENIIGRPFLIYWSVRHPEITGSDGRLERLLYTLVHLPEDARWDRTFRLVR
ncbi:MAG: signal peptidase I [Acidobacteria bacterium]|nr:MAG: signal peptidase I [Acidobacteriota bacterium]PYY17580.1 MAG: signal peptidase I [Acidobacteriota bacterium]